MLAAHGRRTIMEEALKIVILFLVGYAIGAIVIKRKGDNDQL